MAGPNVTAFFDEATNTVTYVVADPSTDKCAVIDSVLDYAAASGRTATKSVDAVVAFIQENELALEWILETHVHADHLTAAPVLRDRLGGKTAIGSNIAAVQSVFTEILNIKDVATDGSQFDRLLGGDEKFHIGELKCRAMHTPGHTPACVTYVIGDAAFVGDTLFMPDFGSARCDFPGGDAATLYDSIQSIFELPNETRLFMCHDYKAPGRDQFAWETTVAEQREQNIHIHDGVSKEEYIEFRTGRDAQLGMPALILPSLQVNIRAGAFPSPEDNGVAYLKVPLNQL